jgi:hypothetical protein
METISEATGAPDPDATGAPRRHGTRYSSASGNAPTAASAAARGLADGFTEASQAFSDEVAGTSTYVDLFEGLFAGFLRANGRFLEEMATVSRRLTDDLLDSGRSATAPPDLDYPRLADLVAARMVAMRADATAAPAAGIDYDRLAELIVAKMAAAAPGGAKP